MKRLFKIVLILLVVVLLIVLVGPFLIPVRRREGLTSPTALAQENSQFLTLAFPGTDGTDIHYRRGGEGDQGEGLFHRASFVISCSGRPVRRRRRRLRHP